MSWVINRIYNLHCDNLGNQDGVEVIEAGGRQELLPASRIFNLSSRQFVRSKPVILLDVEQAKGTTFPVFLPRGESLKDRVKMP